MVNFAAGLFILMVLGPIVNRIIANIILSTTDATLAKMKADRLAREAREETEQVPELPRGHVEIKNDGVKW